MAMAVLFCQGASAVTYVTEQFGNYATGRLGDPGAGNTGGTPGWYTPKDQITVTNGSGSLEGTNLGLVASAGDMIFIAATNIDNGAYNKFVPQSTFPTGNATNIYTSFLYRFNVGTDVSTDGQKIGGMNRQNSGYTSTATFSWFLIAKRVGNDIQIGLTRPGGTTTNYAPTTVVAGQTFFVVIRQQIIPSATTPDVIDLWINPPANTFGTNEANVPPVGATTSDGTDDTSNSGPGRFWIIPSGADANIDELRVADNWAEATPFFGQCLTAKFTVNPTSGTNVAEINSTFKAFATGTAPTYQWQISQNGGSTWTDIDGAVFSSYTTPNLSLATDNGNKYRAIANVSCDGSSVTSAVATVTLTNPVVTPLGVVMDDTFLDPDLGFDSRNNTPVTSSNSVWFTRGTLADRLVVFEQGGNMVGYPTNGASSLWLGYFTDTNQPPVHLDVGRAIKVTLPFTPNSFNAFVTNGALRFGLFDYADGGTRIIIDGDNVTGSTGNGAGVRGYMLSLDFGTNFTANSPLSLLVRTGLGDNNLMGTTGDYLSMGSGPSGGGYSNAPSFKAGTNYVLEFTVARTAVNSATVTAAITGGGTNWSFTSTDTNDLAYHRFDAFGIRPNSLENAADSFTFPEFKVEVIQAAITVLPFNITDIQLLSPGSVKLTWDSVNGTTYNVLTRDSLTTGNWTTNATVQATDVSTSYTNSPIAGSVTERYYRILAQ
jgi:hypothetical protein